MGKQGVISVEPDNRQLLAEQAGKQRQGLESLKGEMPRTRAFDLKRHWYHHRTPTSEEHRVHWVREDDSQGDSFPTALTLSHSGLCWGGDNKVMTPSPTPPAPSLAGRAREATIV